MPTNAPSVISLRRSVLFAAGALAIAGTVVAIWAIRTPRGPVPIALDFDSARIEVERVRENIFVISTTAADFSAGNITVQFGPDGVLLVDTQYQQLAKRNLEAIRAITDRPIEYVVNTHMHVDHVGGNEFFRLSANIAGPADSVAPAARSSGEVKVVAHENALRRLERPIAEGGRRREVWPTDTYSGAELMLSSNGELVRLLHEPRAHTDGDTFVHFVESDVISAGDIYHSGRYPFIDRANGGSSAGIIAALTDLVELVGTSGREPGVTLVIPGHGAVTGEAEVTEYRDMIVVIRDRIRYMIDSGMSLAQVQAARPTGEYDARFGLESGFWTTGEFVAAIYEELASD